MFRYFSYLIDKRIKDHRLRETNVWINVLNFSDILCEYIDYIYNTVTQSISLYPYFLNKLNNYNYLTSEPLIFICRRFRFRFRQAYESSRLV